MNPWGGGKSGFQQLYLSVARSPKSSHIKHKNHKKIFLERPLFLCINVINVYARWHNSKTLPLHCINSEVITSAAGLLHGINRPTMLTNGHTNTQLINLTI